MMEDGAVEREEMRFDAVIVGAGVAGLACAIRIKQVAPAASVCVIDKGSELGAHILSGAVVDPRALDELLPDWRERDCPLAAGPVRASEHWWLGRRGAWRVPHGLLPRLMGNKGCYTGSLGALVRWLGEQAEALGVEIFAGFAGAELLRDAGGAVVGVQTDDKGVGADGQRRGDYVAGVRLLAGVTVLAEGARGHLSEQAKDWFGLTEGCAPQVYGLGIKELWEVDPARHRAGLVMHTQGWPLSENEDHGGAWGGGFFYHQPGGQVALGMVCGLDYANPYVSPYEEFQRWKSHPMLARLLAGGRRIGYGARVVNEGGWQSVPKLAFPGGVLVGCAAGFVNVPRIKGSHTAMKSGMLAGEAIAGAVLAGFDGAPALLEDYEAALRASWVARELQLVANAQPLVARFGTWLGSALAWLDMGLRLCLQKLGLKPFGLMGHRPDREGTGQADLYRPIAYPKPDGVLRFDRLTNLAFAFTQHEEDQPCHLHLADDAVPVAVNLARYDGPEQRYCPAGVYEYVDTGAGTGTQGSRLVINAQNCLHCKSCDIKDPMGNIRWVAPQGGAGPNYANM